MTNSQIEQLWDDHRDNSLTSAQRHQFESFLKENPKAQALFNAESNWLNEIASTSTTLTNAQQTDTFSQNVIHQWQEQIDLSDNADAPLQSSHVTGIAGRIGFAQWHNASPLIKAVAGIAAIVAITIGGLAIGNAFKQDNPAPNPYATNPNNKPNHSAPNMDNNTTNLAVNPVTAMLQSAKSNAALAAIRPAQFKKTVNETAAMFDMNNLMDLIDPGVPDPATLVESTDQPS